MNPLGLRLSPPMVFVPVVRKPWDDHRICIGGGPVGFVRDDSIHTCPIIADPVNHDQKTT